MSAAPLAAFLASLIVFAFCAFASALYGWHSAITGPATAISAVALIACGVWLNRTAGSDGGEDEGPE